MDRQEDAAVRTECWLSERRSEAVRASEGARALARGAPREESAHESERSACERDRAE